MKGHVLRFLPAVIVAGFLLELAVIILVGRAIGILATLLLVIAAGMLGAGIIRSAGLSLANSLRAPAIDRRFASREAAARFLYMLAGLLFIIPGFLSDLLAIALLPAPVRRWLAGKLMTSFRVYDAARPGESPNRGPVIEGEAIEIAGEIADRPEVRRSD